MSTLLPLANNGGPTQTHALTLTVSPAIDAGDNAGCPPIDQRGFPRPRDGNGDGNAVCDMGAYEEALVRQSVCTCPPPSPSPTPALPVDLPRTGGGSGGQGLPLVPLSLMVVAIGAEAAAVSWRMLRKR